MFDVWYNSKPILHKRFDSSNDAIIYVMKNSSELLKLSTDECLEALRTGELFFDETREGIIKFELRG